ncbi:tryptophan-rich sensory protein [Leptothermofonsia sichuanensis E412]|uniref:tryptophan-rich sensory protein n=1 Tax=Leptothermofonsia sichuanensis TaxID=2917832 RepID=UPI001CA748B0|nr:tryptophan-rich sensory protein [Leptothermofonsia sichuanensis]QZZ22215.1 tryptophan-rich sensory protein [Leptothermofonsia sichuanensis E412]
MKAATEKSTLDTLVAIATPIVVIGTIVFNTVFNLFPPGGANVGELANTILRGVQIIPANYAFAIWGLIYLGLIAYSIYQFRPVREGNATLRQVNILLIIASMAQAAWIYLFTLRQFWISVMAMVVILIPLIGIYLTLDIGRTRATRAQKWFVNLPFSVYLGWISVATIVNIAVALYRTDWNRGGISPEFWTALMIAVSAMIAAIAALQRLDVAFTLVFVWAYGAIAVRHLDQPAIWMTASVTGITLIALLVFGSVRRRTLHSGTTSKL